MMLLHENSGESGGPCPIHEAGQGGRASSGPFTLTFDIS